MTPDTMGPFHEKKALIERAAAHGIKSKLNKREWLERQTVIDPIPALFVCVLPDAKAGVPADYQVITGWRLSPNTESGGSSRFLLRTSGTAATTYLINA